MILLDASLGEGLAAGDKASVLTALQQALELEHATIPPYLYALYSLHPDTNVAIAAIIQSVVVEEMLHLTLVANVINALGGSPVLDTANFIPAYPGPLPGAVEQDLVVRLAPFSIELVKEVFLKIEEPERGLDYPVVHSLGKDSEAPLTIGAFYRRIRDHIAALGDDAFVPGPRHQIGPDQMAQAVVVTDAATAVQAIDAIIDQGEGTVAEPLEIVGSGYAHYYRFCEIVKGGLLVPNPSSGPHTPPKERYLYDVVNHAVPFDPGGVFPIPADPQVHGTTTPTYPPGSAGELANDDFNYSYTSLLKVLHRALNGKPELLGPAVGMMMSLRREAMAMVCGAAAGNQNIGPTFEYQPVKPGTPEAGRSPAASAAHYPPEPSRGSQPFG